MVFLAKQLFYFIHLLNSDKGTLSISSGVAIGLILGFSPGLSLQTLIVFLILFLFRIQIAAAMISAIFFGFIVGFFDEIHHQIGTYILEADLMQEIWSTFYHIPFFPLTRFNNTVVMGSAATSLLLSLPTFFLAWFLIGRYRTLVFSRIREQRWYKVFKTTSFYKWYSKYQDIYG